MIAGDSRLSGNIEVRGERLAIDTKPERTRRSDRISIALPVLVFGTEITGQDFFETTRTHLLSRHGAAVVLKRQLAPLQQVTIRNLSSGKEAPAQVVGPLGGRPEGSVYAITLLDPQENLWNMNFPPVSDSEKDCSRIPLECNACHHRELVYLDNLESEVFEANRKITRPCERCSEPTVWHAAPAEAASDCAALLESPRPGGQPARRKGAGGRESRKYPRVRMKVIGCVVQPGFSSEERVTVEDISRGGLSFRAAKVYHEGSIIEVAAPYSPGAANVFVPARVVRVENRPGSQLPLYAVAYLKKPA